LEGDSWMNEIKEDAGWAIIKTEIDDKIVGRRLLVETRSGFILFMPKYTHNYYPYTYIYLYTCTFQPYNNNNNNCPFLRSKRSVQTYIHSQITFI